ncbi:MAG: hypothetical protein ACOVOO_06965 [Flavobacteriales bacterium]|jgi:hypothetical protein
MKKVIMFCAALAVAGTMNAQLQSKKGENYLPETGEYALGTDATSFLSYFGNLANGGTNGGFGFGYTNGGLAITGKRFQSETSAYRGMVRIGIGSMSSTTVVPATSGTGTVEDKTTMSYNNVTLGGGIEKRRGSTRLQGYYGAMAMINLSGSKTSYEYGNGAADGDILESKAGSTFGVGVRAFVGAEYFIIPKLSIGGEFGWGVAFSNTGAGETTIQGADATTTGTSSSFSLDTDNSAFGVAPAAVLVHFHF